MTQTTITKSQMLFLLSTIGDDDPIRILVNKEHLVPLPTDREPHMLDCDVKTLQKMGWANLSTGGGTGGKDGGLTLSTVKTEPKN